MAIGFSLKSIDLFGTHYVHTFNKEKNFKSFFRWFIIYYVLCFYTYFWNRIINDSLY